MFNRIINILTTFFFLNFAIAAAPNELLILISSQDTDYHRQLSDNLRQDIYRQAKSMAAVSGTGTDHIINVQIIHEIFNYPGDWAILTALPHLMRVRPQLLSAKTKWILLCEEGTNIRLELLLARLQLERHQEHVFLGHRLHDQEATIIHHFAFFENPRWFPYPLLRAGIIFSVPLFKSTAEHVAQMQRPRTEFSIDASHELARFIMENVRVDNVGRLEDAPAVGFAGRAVVGTTNAAAPQRQQQQQEQGQQQQGQQQHVRHVDTVDGISKQQQLPRVNSTKPLLLQQAAYICPTQSSAPRATCAMYASKLNATSCQPMHRDTIYFAIKTCHKYHQDRLPALENTWVRYAQHKRYFSDVLDEDIPTFVSGVPNVDTGHCAKTLSILKLALTDIETKNRYRDHGHNEGIQWIFLSDDDTLLSVAGVCDILGCFNSSHNVYLGERYGYRLHAADGFNYITGGGGIAFSLPLVRKILKHCTCPTASSPDDMVLGSCLHTLQVRAVHSARFHQARPNDYAAALLQIEKPISFHKFWQLDPIAVYEQWFANDDRKLFERETMLMQRKHANLPKYRQPAPYKMKPLSSSGDDRHNEMVKVQHLPFLESATALHSKDKHVDL